MAVLAVGTEQGCVVPYCFSGKDRTGVVEALLLDLAGVKRSAIGCYLAANESNLRGIFASG